MERPERYQGQFSRIMLFKGFYESVYPYMQQNKA
jgi:hypothetical protein